MDTTYRPRPSAQSSESIESSEAMDLSVSLSELAMDSCDVTPPASLRSRDVARLQNLIKATLPMLTKHQDKMYKLCRCGRFWNNNTFDILMYTTQQGVIHRAFATYTLGMQEFSSMECFNVKSEEKATYCLPEKYIMQANFMLCLARECILRIDDGELVAPVRKFRTLFTLFDEDWYLEADRRRAMGCFDFVPQADEEAAPNEEKSVVKSAPKDTKSTDKGAVKKTEVKAKAPVKAVKTDKPKTRKKASGTIKKKEVDVKEKAVTEGKVSTNIVLADERTTQKAKLKKSVTDKKPESNKEKNNSMHDIFTRPMMINKFSWGAGDEAYKVLAEYVLPGSYFNYSSTKGVKTCQPMTAAHMLANYGFTRFGVEVTIQINSNKFQCGCLLVYFEPFYMKERKDFYPWRAVTNFPHVWINASDSNPVKFEVPWQNVRDYFPIYCDAQSELNYFGSLKVVVWNTLRAGENTSPDATITVYMNLIDWEVHQQVNPKPAEAIKFPVTIMPYTYPGDPGVTDRTDYELWHGWTVKVPATELIPQMEEAAAVATEGLTMGAHVMEQLAHALTRITNDKPAAPGSGTVIHPKVSQCTAHGEGPIISSPLTLSKKRVTPMHKKFLDTLSPCNLRELMNMESFVGTFTINLDTAENTTLWQWAVTPSIGSTADFKDFGVHAIGETWNDIKSDFEKLDTWYNARITKYSPTMSGFLSLLFLRWMGSIEIRFQAIKTDKHTARIGVMYEAPGAYVSTDDECKKLSKPVVVWDMQESKELKVTLDYASTQPMLSTKYNSISKDSEQPYVVGDYACGTIQAFLINKMKASTGVSKSIDVNIYMSLGKDFEFAVLNDLSNIVSIGKCPTLNFVGDTKFEQRLNQKAAENAYYLEYLIAMGIGYTGDIGKHFKEKDVITDWGKLTICYGSVKTATWTGMITHLHKNDTGNLKILHKRVWEHLKEIIKNRKIERIQHWWHPDTARDYETALHFVKKHMFEWDGFKKLKPPIVEALLKWLPVWHMRHLAVRLPFLPNNEALPYLFSEDKDQNSKILFPLSLMVDPTKTGRARGDLVVQMKEEDCDTLTNEPTKDKGIDLFKDGTPMDSASMKDLMGEDFNDIYKIIRRRYCVANVDFPPFNAGWESKILDTMMEAWRMNPEELRGAYWDIRLPCTPMVSCGYLGDSYGYWSMPGGANPKFRSVDKKYRSGNTFNLTPFQALSHVYTFFRGSLDWTFQFPDGLDEFCYVIHSPDDFRGYGIERTDDGEIMRKMNYGTVLYKGNIMGEVSVTTPWTSRYSRLLISEVRNHGTTQCGCIHVYIPVRRIAEQLREKPDWTQAEKIQIFKRFKMFVFLSAGDDFEYLVPRAAPNVWLWKGASDHRYADTNMDESYDVYPSTRDSYSMWHLYHEGVRRHIVPYENGMGYRKPLRSNDVKIPNICIGQYFSTVTDDERFLNSLVILNTDASYEENKMERDLLLKIEGKGLREENPRDDLRPEGDETEDVETQVKQPYIPVEGLPVSSETYNNFYATLHEKRGTPFVPDLDETDGVKRLPFESLLEGAAYAVIDAPVALAKFTEMMKKASDAFTSAQNTSTVLGEAAKAYKMILNKGIETASVVWDASRIGIVVYSLYSFLNAQDIQARLLSLVGAAAAMGLSFETVSKTFMWMMSSITELFSPSKVEEDTIVQQGMIEDAACLISEHNDKLKVIAAAIGAFALFSFSPSIDGMTKHVGSFASRMVTKLKNVSIIGGGLKTIDWLFKWISGLWTSAYEWACDLSSGGMLTKKALASKFPEVLSWLSEIEHYSTDENQLAVSWNHADKLNVWRLMDRGEQYQKELGSKENYIANYLKMGMTKLSLIHQKFLAVDRTLPIRVDPYCIWIHGPPGVGKSASALTIVNYVADHLGLPTNNRMYARNERDKYWSGYIGQPVVLIDDIGQFTDSEAIEEMIAIKTNAEYSLNMADISEKGRKFRSQLIMCTSNSKYPEPQKMTKKEALWRRRNILAEMCFKNPALKGEDLTHFSNIKFKIQDPSKNDSEVWETLDFAEFMVYCAIGAKKHLDWQEGFVFSHLQGRMIPLPADDDSIHPAGARYQHVVDTLYRVRASLLNEVEPEGEDVAALMNFDEDDWAHAKHANCLYDTSLRRVINAMIDRTVRSEPSTLLGTWFAESTVKEKLLMASNTNYIDKWQRKLRTMLINGDIMEVEGTAEQINENWRHVMALTYEKYANELKRPQGKEEDMAEQAIHILTAKANLQKSFSQWKYYQNEEQDKSVKWVIAANDKEIQDAVAQMYPGANVAKIAAEWKALFERQHKTACPAPTIYKDIGKKREFFSKVDGKWKLCLDINTYDENLLEEIANIECFFHGKTDGEIHDICTALFEETPAKKIWQPTAWWNRFKSWCDIQKTKVEKYFEEHPYIFKTLKIGASIAAFFGGYWLLRSICGETFIKLENKLLGLFGMARETKAVKYLETGVRRAVVTGKDYYDTARERLMSAFGYETKEAQDALVEATNEELKTFIPAAIDNVLLKKKARIGVPPAYFAGDAKKRTVIEMHVDEKHPQGCEDVTGKMAREAMFDNMARISVIAPTGKLRKMTGVFLKQRLLMTPKHFFYGIQEGTTINVNFMRTDKASNFTESFDPESLIEFEDEDLAIYNCNYRFPTRRDITKHIIRKEGIKRCAETAAVVCILSANGVIHEWLTRACMTGDIDYEVAPGEKIGCTRSWEYKAGTDVGDCGGLVVANNPNVPQKLLGMHVAGSSYRDYGYGVVFEYEKIMECIAKFKNPVREVLLPNCYVEKIETDHQLPTGNFDVYGELKHELRNRLPAKTEIRKSPIHGLVREPVTEPAILTPSDERWEWEDTPLLRAVSKYGATFKPFLKRDLDCVSEYVAQEWNRWDLVMRPRVVSDHEAIFGNEMVPYFDRMNMASSPGFPYTTWASKEKGKAWLYDMSEPDGIANENYRRELQQRERCYQQGIRYPHLWTACLKDERRSKEKIAKGKTRAFVLAAADFTHLVRKYFLAFNVNYYYNHSKFHSAVGCDPYSYDWTVIWKRLMSVSNSGAGMDYENFDGGTDPDVIFRLVHQINKWFKRNDPNWKEEDDVVRLVIAEDCMHSLIIVGPVIVGKHGGNPSGGPETTVFNTEVNANYQALAWRNIMRVLRPEWIDMAYFRKHVKMILYGDDGVLAIHPDAQDVYNLDSITACLAVFGYACTSEDKTTKYDIQPLRKCTFLKNGFVPMKGCANRILAPINENTIYELTNWVRKSDDDVLQMRENLRDALKFAFHHGKEYFEKFKEEVNEALATRNLRGMAISYMDIKDAFLGNAG